MKLKRLGQLSIETMIVYGLVILVALSVMGGMLYFNILDLGSYLPDRCDLGGTSDLNCEELSFSAETNNLSLGIRNIGQRPIELLEVRATDETGIHWSGQITAIGQVGGENIGSARTLPPGEIASIELSLADDDDGLGEAQAGRTLRAQIYTQYRFREGAIVQDSSGDVRTRATGSN